MTIDARRAYDVWLQLIADEQLYDATIAGSHRGLAGPKQLDACALEILDAFHAERGTRWNIENLRFRTAYEVSANLKSYIPRTIRMLTKGDDDWLQDIAFEYLSFYQWAELGHHRLAECERFGAYTRARIMKRRFEPPHLDTVLEFELAVVRVLKRTAQLGRPVPVPAATSTLRPQRTIASEIVELPVDIREWVESGDPTRGQPGGQPIAFLVYVPSLEQTHRIVQLSEGANITLQQFDGERSVEEIATAIEREYDLPASQVTALARRWLDDRVLVVSG